MRWRARTGVPWRDLPLEYGPWRTVYGLFRRWQREGVWGRVLPLLKIHLSCEQGQKPLSPLVTDGQRGDSPQLVPVLEAIRVPRVGAGRPRCTPLRVRAGRAYSSRANRAYLRRCDIHRTIAEPAGQIRNRERHAVREVGQPFRGDGPGRGGVPVALIWKRPTLGARSVSPMEPPCTPLAPPTRSAPRSYPSRRRSEGRVLERGCGCRPGSAGRSWGAPACGGLIAPRKSARSGRYLSIAMSAKLMTNASGSSSSSRW
ncbi:MULTISPECIES: transposase [unclassified Streptomyces]|uniref:transposase n=1 Tax=unclassified Streptomyces TaxID=2593676 RepID=UPI00381AD32F